MAETDLTGWCDRGHHHGCSGRLLATTGHHWWCACHCHPDPAVPNTDDGRKALAVWTAARHAIPPAPESATEASACVEGGA